MMYIPKHRHVCIQKAISSEIRSKIKLGEIWFLSYNTSFYYYYYYCLLKHSCLNNFELVLQDQLAYTLIIKECKDKVTQNLIYNLLIKPPSQFPPFWPLTHIPHLPFYYQHTGLIIRLIKHETKQIIYIKSAVSQNSSSKNNTTGHC